MSDAINMLERHLAELVRLNEELLAVIERRRQALSNRDTSALEALAGQERQLVRAIVEEEERRRITMVRLSGVLGRRPDELAGARLATVLPWLDAATRERLAPLAARLKAVAAAAQRVNRESILLVQKFLPYFEELLSILVEGVAGQPSYTSVGRAARSGAAGMNVLDVTV